VFCVPFGPFRVRVGHFEDRTMQSHRLPITSRQSKDYRLHRMYMASDLMRAIREFRAKSESMPVYEFTPPTPAPTMH